MQIFVDFNKTWQIWPIFFLGLLHCVFEAIWLSPGVHIDWIQS
jgi:hypothetical protein